MNRAAAWHEANTAFLEQLVAALRAHLVALADAASPSAELRWPQPEAMQPLPALLLLRDTFGLSGFETAVLALCAAHELDTGIGKLCARAGGDPLRPWPSFGLALHAFSPGTWEAVGAAGPLRAWQLIAVERRPGEPLALAALRVDDRIRTPPLPPRSGIAPHSRSRIRSVRSALEPRGGAAAARPVDR